MKTQNFLKLVLSAVLIFSLSSCSHIQYSKSATAYYILNSAILERGGFLTGIDINGRMTERRNLHAQDVYNYSLNDDGFAAAGCRGNVNLLLDENGSLQEFHSANDAGEYGACAVTRYKDKAVVIINETVENGIYQNLLTIQDHAGHIEHQKMMEILASKAICIDGIVYVVGSEVKSASDEWSGKVISYDLKTDEFKENTMSDIQEYRDIALIDNKLYCITQDFNGNMFKIDVIDANTLEKIADFSPGAGEVSNVLNVQDSLYAVVNNAVCKISDNEIEKVLYYPPNDLHADVVMSSKDHVYVLCRYEHLKELDNNMADVGIIADIDCKNEKTVETPLKLVDEQCEDIIFRPAASILN